MRPQGSSSRVIRCQTLEEVCDFIEKSAKLDVLRRMVRVIMS